MSHAVQPEQSEFEGKHPPAICDRFKLPTDFSLTCTFSFLMSLSVLCHFHYELVTFSSFMQQPLKQCCEAEMVISLTVLNIISVIQAVIRPQTSVLKPAWASLGPVSHQISYLLSVLPLVHI